MRLGKVMLFLRRDEGENLKEVQIFAKHKVRYIQYGEPRSHNEVSLIRQLPSKNHPSPSFSSTHQQGAPESRSNVPIEVAKGEALLVYFEFSVCPPQSVKVCYCSLGSCVK